MRAAYLVAAIALFAIEVLIALFVRDNFVRPYVGDVLAVALVYCSLRAATPLSVNIALAATLAIAFAIEIAQALGLLATLGLAGNAVARIVLGGTFDWADLGAYLAGAVIIVLIERARETRERGRA